MDESLVCSICGQGPFKDRRGLRGHQAIKHGVEKRVVTDSRSLETLTEIAKNIEYLTQQSQASLQQLLKQFDSSANVSFSAQDLAPMANDLSAIKAAVFDNPNMRDGLTAVANDVKEVVEPPSSEKEEVSDGFWVPWGLTSSKKEDDSNREGESEGFDWGWLVLAGIGFLWLRAALRNRESASSES